MLFSSWRRNLKRPVPAALRRPPTIHSQRPTLEALGDRTLPSNFTASGVSDLINDINAANTAGGTNTITLIAGVDFDLTMVNNTTNGADGLPVISGASAGKKSTIPADDLIVIGNGDIIRRDASAPAFRLFDVAQGASLTLEDVNLQNGRAFGSGAAADGGAIYNQGNLTLDNTIVTSNTALGSNGSAAVYRNKTHVIPAQPAGDAAGGGIWSSGTLIVENGSSILSNQAEGGRGGSAAGQLNANGGAGGGGFGGGIYMSGGSLKVIDATLAGNVAVGGWGGGVGYGSGTSGDGGDAAGGALDVAGGTLDMSNAKVTSNAAWGGSGGAFSGFGDHGGTGGTASGGGIYVGGGTVSLQTLTLSGNYAAGGDGGFERQTEGITVGYWTAVHGFGGSALGGGLCVAGGSVTVTGSSVTGNRAFAGVSGELGIPTGSVGIAAGGGIDIISPAAVFLDSSTVINTTGNYDEIWNGLNYTDSEDNVNGPYTPI